MIRDRAQFPAGTVIRAKDELCDAPAYGLRANATLVKFCASLSLLLVLLVWFDLPQIIQKLVFIDLDYVAIAIIFFALQLVLSSARWVIILSRQKVGLKWRDALSIFGMGTLANLFLVTSIAGLSVRGALLVRAGAGISGAFASLTAERIAAMAGLGICGVAGLVFAFPELQRLIGETSHLRAAGLAAGGLAALAGVAFLVFRKFNAPRNFVLTVWMAFSSARQALLLISVSAAVVLSGFAGMAALASGMGLAIDPVFFVSVMPAVAFISALPVSVGGWGVREGAMVVGLSIFSVPAESALALSVSYGLGGLLVALLIGAMFALMGQHPMRTKPV